MKSIHCSLEPIEWALLLCSYICSDSLTWFSISCQNSLKKQKNHLHIFIFVSKDAFHFIKKEFLAFWNICAFPFILCNKHGLRHNGQHTNIITTYRYKHQHQHQHPHHHRKRNHDPHITWLPSLLRVTILRFHLLFEVCSIYCYHINKIMIVIKKQIKILISTQAQPRSS